jgi:hypothetical protein
VVSAADPCGRNLGLDRDLTEHVQLLIVLMRTVEYLVLLRKPHCTRPEIMWNWLQRQPSNQDDTD